ncbi:MAG: hypothetical protein ACD_77C00167G0001, partial [uncultured bacterium]
YSFLIEIQTYTVRALSPNLAAEWFADRMAINRGEAAPYFLNLSKPISELKKP